jgi:indole-3-glycerol phosphate synthase
MVDGILDRIVTSVAARLDRVPAAAGLVDRAREVAGERARNDERSLGKALRDRAPAVIAECKRASPSAGILRADFDPVRLARAYSAAGASAISVVTEPEFFHGDPRWLSAVRNSVELPVLRKDFIVDDRQLYESVMAGADAVLLIQRILAPERLERLLQVAAELRLEVLLEIFADENPEPAVASGVSIVGVNARDLATVEVDLERVATIAGKIPDDRLKVAESGIQGRDDLVALHRAGYNAFLVGEHLVRAGDPGDALRALLGD